MVCGSVCVLGVSPRIGAGVRANGEQKENDDRATRFLLCCCLFCGTKVTDDPPKKKKKKNADWRLSGKKTHNTIKTKHTTKHKEKKRLATQGDEGCLSREKTTQSKKRNG